MKQRNVLLIASLLLLGGCGTIGNMVIQDASLEQKAAFALNTTADKVKISNRSGSVEMAQLILWPRQKVNHINVISRLWQAQSVHKPFVQVQTLSIPVINNVTLY